MNIQEAIKSLNPEDDSQWTDDGLPLVDVIRQLTGDNGISRQDITDTNPEFCRNLACTTTMTKTDLDKTIQELQEERDVIDTEISRLQKDRDQMQEVEYRTVTTDGDMQARINYIKTQQAIRISRVLKSQEILKGINPADLNPAAPLDQAMVRKTQRGMNRPMRLPEAPIAKE